VSSDERERSDDLQWRPTSARERFSDEDFAAQQDDFLTAMRGGDLDRSDRLLGELRSPLPDHLLLSVAELHILRERWSDAA